MLCMGCGCRHVMIEFGASWGTREHLPRTCLPPSPRLAKKISHVICPLSTISRMRIIARRLP